MAINTILQANIILTVIAIIFSGIAIFLYFRGLKKFLSGDFKLHAKWMFFGVILYTIHLFAHLTYLLAEAGWLNVSEDLSELSMYIFLVAAGVFFLGGSYLYLKLANEYGFKK